VRRRSNCFFFAWWLFWTRGGYCSIRRVRPPLPFGWHWQWSPDSRHWLHYEPVDRKTTLLSAALHKLWFVGRIRRYDTPWGENRTR
jgi:hypothetical protein